jgi:8-oxo-dGTP diphosphatase
MLLILEDYMITLLNGAAAFLRRGDDFLLLKRADDRKFAPGLWGGVGGKFESGELNDPQAACLREIYEETGISAEDVHNLSLRYIIMRRKGDVIWQSYIYFGETDTEPSIDTDEGRLHWIPQEELMDRTFTVTFTQMLRHYLTHQYETRVTVGAAANVNGECVMNWTVVEDFDC